MDCSLVADCWLLVADSWLLAAGKNNIMFVGSSVYCFHCKHIFIYQKLDIYNHKQNYATCVHLQTNYGYTPTLHILTTAFGDSLVLIFV